MEKAQLDLIITCSLSIMDLFGTNSISNSGSNNKRFPSFFGAGRSDLSDNNSMKDGNKKQNGLVVVPGNVSTIDASFDTDMLENVDEEDKAHMILVLDYISYDICQAHQKVSVTITKVVSLDYDGSISYQMTVFIPSCIGFSTEHTDAIRAKDFNRITRPITWELDEKSGKAKITIHINSSKNKYVVEKVTVTVLHLKRTRLNNIINEENDDQRGSTKRTRTEM